MRERVFEFLESQEGRGLFGLMFESNAAAVGSLENYVADRRRDRIYGGEFEYAVLAQIFQIHVEIYFLGCTVGGKVFQSSHSADDNDIDFGIKMHPHPPMRRTGGDDAVLATMKLSQHNCNHINSMMDRGVAFVPI